MRRVMRLASIPAVILALAVTACGDEESERPPAPVVQQVQPPAPEDDPNRLFDLEGNLLESDEVVAGLTLPRGLEAAGEADRFHAYTTSVPIDKVQAYFGPRLVTGQVDRHGSGATFRQAVPREARGGIVKLDVAIVPMSQVATRIEIRELPPVPENPPTEAEVLLHWDQEQQQLD
jgi:hypothetical protein